MQDLIIETRTVGQIPILNLCGELDSYHSPSLREKIAELIDSGHALFIIDLSQLNYIDSSGLGTMVAGLKQSREKGGVIRIICPNEEIYKVFSITGLIRAFDIYHSEEAATVI